VVRSKITCVFEKTKTIIYGAELTRLLFICSISMAISKVPLLPCPKRERLGVAIHTPVQSYNSKAVRKGINSTHLKALREGMTTEPRDLPLRWTPTPTTA
jgi:hypothetical protein